MTSIAGSDVVAPPFGSSGRPRDARIDEAVLLATSELLVEVGYLRLSIGAVAERAGTNKPAIYRRWPTKAHLVHEAVFPVDRRAVSGAAGKDLRADIRALVAVGVEFLSRPAARAALPGLMAEVAGDAALHADILARFSTSTWGWLQTRVQEGIDRGEVRRDVDSSTVLDLIAGSTLVATTLHPVSELDAAWVERVVDIIIGGIAPR